MSLASFQPPSLAQPLAGSMAIAQRLDFTASGRLNIDLSNEVIDGKLDFIQTIYIDNADNTAALDILFTGGPRPQRIRAQPYSQGFYAVTWPKGMARLTATTAQGIFVDVIYYNCPMPYVVWGPKDGALSVPSLTTKANNAVALGIGNTQLVAGILGETIRLYLGSFSVNNPAVLKWTDGPGGTVLFTAQLTAGGSMFFSGSGVPWFATTPGNDLTLNSDSAVTLYGGFGYVQN